MIAASSVPIATSGLPITTDGAVMPSLPPSRGRVPYVTTGPRFTPRTPPDADLGGYTSRAISTSAYRYQARFTLHVSAEKAAERIAPTTGALEPIDERSCTLRAGSDSLDELAIYVAGKGFGFEVHEPPELVEHVRVLAARLGKAVS